MRYLTWCGCVAESRKWGLLPHLDHAFAEFLELAAVLEHVACLLLAIPLVDVEVDGAWTRKFLYAEGPLSRLRRCHDCAGRPPSQKFPPRYPPLLRVTSLRRST